MSLPPDMRETEDALRAVARSRDWIARRRGRMETLVSRRRELVLALFVPPLSPGEWDAERRPQDAREVPREHCPGPIGQIGLKFMDVIDSRRLDGRLCVMERQVGERDAWVLEVTVLVPDERTQRQLKQFR